MLRSHRPKSLAFTLIELLVVISIIALLIGILLPALGKARESGRSAVCMSNLRNAGQGLHTYSVEGDGYYPGMNTSGYLMTTAGGLNNAQMVAQAARGASYPLQADDWISPALGVSLGLPSVPAERMLRIFQDEFCCPTNNVEYAGLYSGGDIYGLANRKLRVSSYSMSTVWQMRKTGRQGDDAADGDSGAYMSEIAGNYDTGFRMEGILNPSNKVVVSEGCRYMEQPNTVDGHVTYNGDSFSLAGTNFSTNGWIYTTGGGGPYRWGSGSQSTSSVGVRNVAPGSRSNAFRHQNLTINMLKFDGSAFSAGVEEAVKIYHHVPKGVTLTSTTNTADPDDFNGMVVGQ